MYLRPAFETDDGEEVTLSAPKTQLLYNQNTGQYYHPSGTPYNPANSFFGGTYTLTTKEGIDYKIDGQSGDLLTVTDTNGNTLTYSDEGIVSSTGQSVTFERNAAGQIVAAVDPEGNKIQYEYDENGDLVAVTDREENTTRFEYHEERSHYLEEVIDPLGRSGVRSEYDESGRLSKMLDVNGETVELVYDPDNSTQTVLDVFGNPTTYVYDDRGNVVTELDPVGLVTNRTYDEDNNVLTETVITEESGPDGWTTTRTYDAQGNKLSETDPLGNVSRWTYNNLGRVLTETDALGQTTTNTYSPSGNLLSTTDAEGNVTEFSYDIRGNLLSLKLGDRTTNFGYYADGNVKNIEDSLGNKADYIYSPSGKTEREVFTIATPEGDREVETTWAYDNEGRIKSILQSNDRVEYRYDASGNQVQSISQGEQTNYRYDSKGQLIETIYPDDTPDDSNDNPRSITVYDRGGTERATIDLTGRVTHYERDAAERLRKTIYDSSSDAVENLVAAIAPGETPQTIDWTQAIYPDLTPTYLASLPSSSTEYYQNGWVKTEIDETGERIEYKYDPVGRQTEVRYDENNYLIYTYDKAGNRRTETYNAEGTTSTNVYDELGQLIAATDQNNHTTQYEYDEEGRLAAVVDARNGRTEYGYNDSGQIETIEDALGQVTSYEYNDPQGRLTATILSNGKRSTAVYNDSENSVTKTDFNGEAIKYVYDELGNLEKKEFLSEGTSVSYSYNADQRIEAFTSSRGTTVYKYDELGRLISRTDPNGLYIADSGATIEYEYSNGDLISVETPNQTVTYDYYDDGTLKSVTSPLGTTTYQYREGDLYKTLFPNNTAEIIEYDALDRLDVIRTARIDPDTEEELEVIASYDYELDNAGNRLEVADHNGRKVEYKYDELNRLIEERVSDPSGGNNGDRVITYSYDAVGNRLTKNDSFEGLTTYTYENNLLVTETYGSDVIVYKYDNNGNLTERIKNSTERTTYNWDDENRLIEVINPGGETISYAYNQNNIRVSSTVNGKTINYLVDGNRPYAQVLQEYVDGQLTANYVYGLDLISQEQGGLQSFYHLDGLGSTRALTDEGGNVTDTYAYDAYGNLIAFNGNTDNSYLFAGEQYDSNLSQYYLRQRYYDPAVGRFTRRDTYDGRLEEPITLHKYLYANANPVNFTDPSGLFSLGEITIARKVRNSLASLQLESYSYLISPTIHYARGQGEYKIGDFFLDLSLNAFFALAPVLAPYVVSGARGMIRRLRSPKAYQRGGSGVPKGVSIFDEVESPAIIQQYTNEACGVTCGAQALQDLGIKVTPQEVAQAAGTEFVNGDELIAALNKIYKATPSAAKSWYSEYAPIKKASIDTLNTTGSWIAQYKTGNWSNHWVIVDGFDEAQNLKIRDPWGLSEAYQASEAGLGTKYTISFDDFKKLWTGLVAYLN